MALPEPVNVEAWISDNRRHFAPPVCNKMLHSAGQLKLFFVGGPNRRKDYHIEEGEELFYMQRGGMLLKLLIGDEFVEQEIGEGQLFLLPGNVFHSPQRAADTVGWVIERERRPSELDGLRYFCEAADGRPTPQPLWEKYVFMRDLGSQVAEVIREFSASESCRSGRPQPGGVCQRPPVAACPQPRGLPAPVTLRDWLADRRRLLDEEADGAGVPVFDGRHQFVVEVVGAGDGRRAFAEPNCETWLLQLAGSSEIFADDCRRLLGCGDSLLVPAGVAFRVRQQPGARLLKAAQDPDRKPAA